MKLFTSKESKGITLIALVITIIVLLILAGVTIAMIVGDNGILTRSNEAKEVTNIAKITEEIDLKDAEFVLEYQAEDYYTETTDNEEETPVTYTSVTEYVYDQINHGRATKSGEYTVKAEKKTGESNTVYKVTVKDSSGKTIKTGSINESGKIDWDDEVEVESAVSTITTSDYGADVDIKIDINGDNDTTNDWKLFLNDGSNIYLIANDYIPSSMCPQSIPKVEGRTTRHSLTPIGTDKYLASFNDDIKNDYNGASDIANNSLLNSSYNIWANQEDLGDFGSKSGIKCVAYMLDTDAWGGAFINENNSEYIDYVIGGPTIEMLSAAYNEKHKSDENFETNIKMGWSLQWSGYWIKKGNSNSSTQSGYELTDDSLFFVNRDERNCNYMWIASTSGADYNALLYDGYNGKIGYTSTTANDVGFRPVIKLKNNVNLTDNNGIYEL